MSVSVEPLPDPCRWERQFWECGYVRVAGVDEVGRGALAGPLVAAAVILPASCQRSSGPGGGWGAVRDSKTLLPARRTALADWIVDQGTLVSIAAVSCEELDGIGLAAANRCAMERAVDGLPKSADVLLLDATTVDLDTPQVGLIDGDAQCLSIATASIVAKVFRDAIMVAHDPAHPAYGFARHKGYGVPLHLQALATHGPCVLHRQSFAPVARAARHHDHHVKI